MTRTTCCQLNLKHCLRSPWCLSIMGMAIAVFLYLLAAFLWAEALGSSAAADGLLLVKKIIAAGVMPAALIGLLLLTLSAKDVIAYGQSRRAGHAPARRNPAVFFPLPVLCILYWSASTPLISSLLLPRLQKPYEHINTLADDMTPLDVIFVLGGGTGVDFHGEAQVGRYGGRVVTAARLFHAGKVKRLICTGSNIKGLASSDALDPGASARLILLELNVPDSVIEIISGRNTKEEMVSIKKYLAHHQPASAGLITSAFHMKRAMRLAEKQNLDLQPLPSNLANPTFQMSWTTLIPSANTLISQQIQLTEHLAQLAGH